MENINLKIIRIILIINASIFFITPSLKAQQPSDVVIQGVNKGIEVLHNYNLQDEKDFEACKEELWEILSPAFDFKAFSKRVLGPYWREISQKEREDFIKTFTNILKNVYLSKTSSYSGENLVYLGEFTRGNRSRVRTNFITSEGREISVHFNMHKSNNKWKIYDVIIEGVSIVNNYRNQFNSILANSSFSELMQRLKEREQELNSD